MKAISRSGSVAIVVVIATLLLSVARAPHGEGRSRHTLVAADQPLIALYPVDPSERSNRSVVFEPAARPQAAQRYEIAVTTERRPDAASLSKRRASRLTHAPLPREILTHRSADSPDEAHHRSV